MDNFMLSLNIILPLFLLMALGSLISFVKLVDAPSFRSINRLTFNVLLPTLLFYNIYKTDLEGVLNIKLLIFAAVTAVTIFGVVTLVTLLIEKDNLKRGPLIQGICRSNSIIFGLPISIALFGAEMSGVTAMVVAVVIPIFNVLSVIILSVFREKQFEMKALLLGILKNPLIIGSVLGLLMLRFQIVLPVALEKTAADVAKAATPLAIIGLGGSFRITSVRENWSRIVYGVLTKLIVIPAIFIPLSIKFGFVGPELVALMTLYSSPAAVSSYTMAQQMDADHELAGQLVVFGSVLSVVTMFMWIFTLKNMMYL